MDPGRRRLLIGGGATLAVVVVGAAGAFGLVEEGVVPGKARLDRWLGACGSEVPPPAARPGPMVSGSFRSSARRGLEIGWTAAYPPGSSASAALPVCVLLHARGGTHRWPFARLGLQHHLAAAVGSHTVGPFVLVSVDGGDATNWHRRADGDDPPAMIEGELLPRLADRGLTTGPSDRIGLWGWSLGGYGALLLAEKWGPTKVAAVAAASPAVWASYGDAQSGTFDGEADFGGNDVLRGSGALEHVPVRIDTGGDDPFAGSTRRLMAAVHPTPAGGVSSGCHDPAFWSRHAAAELAFVGARLTTT